MILTTFPASQELKHPKRPDLVVEDIKRWIVRERLQPGDKLPKERELRELFRVSQGTIRGALKSLEVQGLISISTGPNGGATLVEVPLERTLQLLQNYFYFKRLTYRDIYLVRRILEPELAAGAVDHLADVHFEAMQRSIDRSSRRPSSFEESLEQRQEDLRFHDILADAHPNEFLKFMCYVMNAMLRQLVVIEKAVLRDNWEFGRANVKAHRALLEAYANRDKEKVRRLMEAHMRDAERHLGRLAATFKNKLLLDADLRAEAKPKLNVLRLEKRT